MIAKRSAYANPLDQRIDVSLVELLTGRHLDLAGVLNSPYQRAFFRLPRHDRGTVAGPVTDKGVAIFKRNPAVIEFVIMAANAIFFENLRNALVEIFGAAGGRGEK